MATRQRQPSTVTLRLRRTFPAAPERVFHAWPAPEELERGLASGHAETPVAELDPRGGGKTGPHLPDPRGQRVCWTASISALPSSTT